MISDTGQVYWQARLSERYPTLEVRCADVQLRADAAVMFTGLIRAMVTTALRAEEAGEPLPTALRSACRPRTGARPGTAWAIC